MSWFEKRRFELDLVASGMDEATAAWLAEYTPPWVRRLVVWVSRLEHRHG